MNNMKNKTYFCVGMFSWKNTGKVLYPDQYVTTFSMHKTKQQVRQR